MQTENTPEQVPQQPQQPTQTQQPKRKQQKKQPKESIQLNSGKVVHFVKTDEGCAFSFGEQELRGWVRLTEADRKELVDNLELFK